MKSSFMGMEAEASTPEMNISTERGFCGLGCGDGFWTHSCLKEKAILLPLGQGGAAEEAVSEGDWEIGRRQ